MKSERVSLYRKPFNWVLCVCVCVVVYSEVCFMRCGGSEGVRVRMVRVWVLG